jgi:hypothetical protein
MNNIQQYENLIRKIIIHVLYLKYGDDYEDFFGVTVDRLNIWKEKRNTELKRFKGIASESRLIHYSDFYDLKKIITHNWILFKEVFNDKKTI